MSDESKLDFPGSRHFGVAIKTSGMGVWTLAVDDGTLHLSRRSREIHGFDAGSSEVLELPMYLERVHKDDRWKLNEALATDSLESFRDLEYRLAEQTDGTHWVRLSGDVEKNAEGCVVAVAGSCFDISEQMNLHRQLLQSQKMETVGQLTAGIAHNFNNILSAVLPSLHLVGPYVAPEGAKLIRNARLAAERATDLISELMLVAGRKTERSRVALDVVDIVERVVRICRTTFGGWIQLNLEYDSDMPDLLGNESQIEQVLLNLLLNARDAFEESSISCPRIDLEIENQSEAIVLRVMDNGPGMDADTLQRIFEPFFTTKSAGTGLGLATAYAIVGDHGGSIECWSKPESGTEFRMEFPPYRGAADVVSAKGESPKHVGGHECILLVDDDTLVRRVTAVALREAGYEVLEAVGGSEALTKHRATDLIDLVVLDMAMPEMTGDLVLETMRLEDPEVKVLVFTGLSDARVERLSGVSVLQKPAGVNELLGAVRDALDQRQLTA